jgi:hypothetical protein
MFNEYDLKSGLKARVKVTSVTFKQQITDYDFGATKSHKEPLTEYAAEVSNPSSGEVKMCYLYKGDNGQWRYPWSSSEFGDRDLIQEVKDAIDGK